ncbi:MULTISPECIES: sigma-70 family RNA polymerase sigma factor [unclassified Endozoicomonas]|uniref:sigma-70 family RNA polymerase sigma factor n=1 Tax=unclassified Endozoicomonas TaxID=2644528 RepID=UPI002147C4A2|nr:MULTISPECIES: RNA polymerase sigma factor FliA [unclassified Endozoicomonas]
MQQKGLNAYRQQAGNQRDVLVKQHLSLVKKIVLHLASSLGSNISRDDLLQAGMMGLLDAASRYDPGRKVPFEQFAKTRIRGAVIDELRQWDWRSRTDREHGQKISNAIQKLNTNLGRAPSESEIAEELGVSLERYHRMLQGSSSDSLLSLDGLMQGESDSRIIEINDDDSVEVVAMGGERSKALAKALQELPEREQHLMNLYYVHELNMKEIGEALDLTEARICQLHRQAVLRLRSLLEEWNRD